MIYILLDRFLHYSLSFIAYLKKKKSSLFCSVWFHTHFHLNYNSLLISSPCNFLTYHVHTLFQHECFFFVLFFVMLDSVVDNEEQCGTIVVNVSWLPDFRTCLLTRCRWFRWVWWNGINFPFPTKSQCFFVFALWGLVVIQTELFWFTPQDPAFTSKSKYQNLSRCCKVFFGFVECSPLPFFVCER